MVVEEFEKHLSPQLVLKSMAGADIDLYAGVGDIDPDLNQVFCGYWVPYKLLDQYYLKIAKKIVIYAMISMYCFE